MMRGGRAATTPLPASHGCHLQDRAAQRRVAKREEAQEGAHAATSTRTLGEAARHRSGHVPRQHRPNAIYRKLAPCRARGQVNRSARDWSARAPTGRPQPPARCAHPRLGAARGTVIRGFQATAAARPAQPRKPGR